MALNAGDVLKDRYTIESLLGYGGMGAVYRACDLLHNNTFCAVKELRSDYLEGTVLRDTDAGRSAGGERPRTGPREEALDLFRREAKILANLPAHPNLPKVTDYFREENSYYLVMTLIEGETLADRMGPDGDQPLPESQVLVWMRQVLDALEHCHDNNVIHLDVKPANIIVIQDLKVFLVDFGIARFYKLERGLSRNAPVVSAGFSPPEHYSPGPADRRSDIYSVGATMYQLLTGQIPPEAPLRSSGQAVLFAPSATGATVSSVVDAAVMKALALDVNLRFQSIAEFRSALGLSKPSDPKPKTPPDKPRPPGSVKRLALRILAVFMIFVAILLFGHLASASGFVQVLKSLLRIPAIATTYTPTPSYTMTIAPLTFTPVPSHTMTIAPPTSTPAPPTHTTTLTPSPTVIPVTPSQTPVTPTATQTPTSLPTSTRATTPRPMPTDDRTAPVLTGPEDGARYSNGKNDIILLTWQSQPLKAGEAFVVVIRRRARNSEVWPDYQWTEHFSVQAPTYVLDDATSDRFEWQVQVVRKDPAGSEFGDSEHRGVLVGIPSATRVFYWIKMPTPEPPPPPPETLPPTPDVPQP